MSNAITISNLKKSFNIYRSSLKAVICPIFSIDSEQKNIVLNGIDLSIKRGEIVGVLGKNGAGKSTLLKILAGTLTATSGTFEIYGKLTALLELGAGFHPEYSGRENIIMGGLCLGMSYDEVLSKVPEIIEFSELSHVIDNKFKTYSTGMQARLTFSTAISVSPDILIIDEALSVGDSKFQAKCFSKLQKLRENTTTVLIVSHDINTINSLCDRAILINEGRIISDGEPSLVTSVYHNLLFSNESSQLHGTNKKNGVRYGSNVGVIVRYGILDSLSNEIENIRSGDNIKFEFEVNANTNLLDISYGFAIKDKRGVVVWGSTNISQNMVSDNIAINSTSTISCYCTLWLANGTYTLTLGIAENGTGNKIDFIDDALVFNVYGADGIFTNSIVNLQSKIQAKVINDK